MKAVKQKENRRNRRKLGVRSRMQRRSSLVRLSVNRTLKHISAQLIDDATGRTLCSATTTSKTMAGDLEGKTKSEQAALLGAEIARKAVGAGVDTVVLDRGSSRYHGRVKALADAAREGGLKF